MSLLFHGESFGEMNVRPAVTETNALLTVTMDAHHESGLTLSNYEHLTRPDVERLRELCDEALS